MEIIKSEYSQDFNGSHRTYFDLDGARLIDVHHFDNTKESWHKHLISTEVLFILNGKIEARTQKLTKTIKENEIVSFPAEEWHRIKPLTLTTRILVFKYVPLAFNSGIENIKNDYVGLNKK